MRKEKVTTKIPHASYSETQAAEQLGVTVEQLRSLIHNHIADKDETSPFLQGASFSRSDLVLLRLLLGKVN